MLAFLRLILKFYLARYPHEQKESFEEAILRCLSMQRSCPWQVFCNVVLNSYIIFVHYICHYIKRQPARSDTNMNMIQI